MYKYRLDLNYHTSLSLDQDFVTVANIFLILSSLRMVLLLTAAMRSNWSVMAWSKYASCALSGSTEFSVTLKIKYNIY